MVQTAGCPSRSQAGGEWLLFLHADTRLTPGWASCCLDHLSSHSDNAGYFRLAFDTGGVTARMVSAWANLRSRIFGLPYGDQGLLVSCKLYHAVGGYSDIPLMEDVKMARALRGRLRMLGARLITSAARYETDGWFRRGARNLMTLLRYFLGTDPEILARNYRR